MKKGTLPGQEAIVAATHYTRERDYWAEKLSGDIVKSAFPYDYDNHDENESEKPVINSSVFDFQADAVSPLLRIANNSNPRLHMILTAVLAILLGKYSGNKDIIIGTPIYDQGVEKEFINTVLTLRIPLESCQTFKEFLLSVRQTIIEAVENQNYPIRVLPLQAEVSFSSSDLPLFDTVILLENIHNKQYLADITPNIGFIFRRLEDRLQMELDYNSKLYHEETIQRIGKNYLVTLHAVLSDLDIKTGAIDIISDEEKTKLLYEFNNTGTEYPRNKTIPQLFTEQVEQTPDHMAIIGQTHRSAPTGMTYRELNNQAGGLAQSLIEKGVLADDIVGIMVERSLEMVIGLLGILKAGGAYLPIDSTYPQERIEYMLKDSNAKILINKSEARNSKFETNPNDKNSNDQNKNRYSGAASVLDFEHLNFDIVSDFDIRASNFNSLNLAYIIYTSGSTGTPKGSGVYHGGFMNLVNWYIKEFGFNSADSTLLLTSPSFDLTQKNIYAPLLVGGKLYLKGGDFFEPPELVQQIWKNKISWINCTPGMFYKLVEDGEELYKLSGLRFVFLGGESISPGMLRKWYDSGECKAEVVNTYGPTECTDVCAYYRLKEKPVTASVPVGKPVYNTRLFIVDTLMGLSPVGVAGELCIVGQGVGAGYINHIEMTAEKFNKDLWDVQDNQDKKNKSFAGGPGGRFYKKAPLVYKTGDLARRLPDGNIEFLGRIDRQVKIRGFRLELEEIESRLLRHEKIKEAVVSIRDDKMGDHYLCAYIVPNTHLFPDSQKFLSTPQLQDYLSGQLPLYMIPSYFISIEKIPLTPNGKVDRNALPAPEMGVGSVYVPPGDRLEKELAAIWEEVLDRSPGSGRGIGVGDNFFRLGGHSLKAAALLGKIHKRLKVKMNLEDIFKYSTIRELAEFIKQAPEFHFSSIGGIEEKEYYELSSAQKRLYILQQMDKDGTAYHITSAWILQGNIDKNKIEKSIRELIRRHESLRTSFDIVDEEPVQRIHEYKSFAELFQKGAGSPIPLKKLPEEWRPPEAIIKSFIRPFDLTCAPLLRVGLVELEKEKHLLMVDMHHIISDGMSSAILIRDFTGIYLGNKLPEINLQYKDYAQWQNREKGSESFKRQENYWIREFAGEIPVLELPTDYVRPAVQGFEGANINFELTMETTVLLKPLALKAGATLYQALLALYAVFLAKVSSREDIVIGTPVAGRRHTDLEQIIGMFVNTLALRNYPSGEKKFSDFLLEVKENTVKGLDNQDYQYEELVEQVVLSRDISRNPLFDVMFVLQNTGIQALAIPGLSLVPYEYENKTAKFDLTLSGVEVEDKLLFTFEYSTKLFKRETIERFIGYFKNVINGVIENRDRRISDFEIITEEEKHRVLYDFNNTEKDYPNDKTISRLFAEQAERTPDHIALISDQPILPVGLIRPVSLSYRQLNDRSNCLAWVLKEKGVQPDTIVGILIERSLAVIVAIYAVLKAGGAYLPIDPNYPRERVAFMVKESEAKILIASRPSLQILSRGNRNPTELFAPEVLEVENPALYWPPPPALDSISAPGNLAYMIYTSGSTGSPKGVSVKLQGFANLLHWFIDEFNIHSRDRVLLIAPVSFDLAQKNLFSPLIRGGTLCLPAPEFLDYHELSGTIVRQQITIINSAPSVFYPLIEFDPGGDFSRLKSLRYVFMGGEPIRVNRLEPWLNSQFCQCEVVNTYGPTECTDIAAFYRLRAEDLRGQRSIPIGKPIYNVKVYVLANNLQVLPVGVVGELFIGGIGLAKGYHHEPGLTAEKFFPWGDHLIYRTGDRGRWLPDGNVEFLGRIDHQVKIRGYRIELEEIERQLSRYDKIKEVVVISRQDKSGENYLCAYIVSENPPPVSGLRGHLSEHLPDYMIPAYFVPVAAIPLTPSGKVNRKALPEPAVNLTSAYIPPGTEIEKKLVEIWSRILKIDKNAIGIDANFFQLGGHSLKAMTLTSILHRELAVKVNLADIFKNQTVRSLSHCLKESGSSKHIPVLPTEKKEYHMLSSAQKRFYILQQMETGNTAYNIASIISLKKEVKQEPLAETFNRLIRRHEILRTTFTIVDGEPVQVVHDDFDFKIESDDVTLEDFIRPFDLSRLPLLRAGLVKTSEEKQLLLIEMHHIVSDEVSMLQVLIPEFCVLYAGGNLAPLELQYKDYAHWLQNNEQQEKRKQQEIYWLNMYHGKLPVLHLPLDFPRPPVQSFAGSRTDYLLSEEQSRALKKIAGENNVTLFMLLFSLFTLFISKLADTGELIVGTPVAGRRHADLENMVGVFVNTLALRIYVPEAKNFPGFLREVKESILEAFENQEYPFEDLVDKVLEKRAPNRNPLFDVMFAFYRYEENAGLQVDPGIINNENDRDSFKRDTNQFELGMSVDEGQRLLFRLEYSTNVFKEESIKRYMGYFRQLITIIIDNPQMKIADMEMIPPDEKKEILNLIRLESEGHEEIPQAPVIFPRNPVEEKLAGIWQRILNKENIGVNENIFELGSNSLKMLMIVSEMNREFNKNLLITDIFEAPTIGRLAELIISQEQKVPAVTDENLVLLKKGVDKEKNLFLIHDVSGEVEAYFELCNRLEVNCWGIKAGRLKNYSPADRRIEDLAREYLGKIKKVQKGGPFYILGWSLGAIIAFEMAIQLEKINEKNVFLVMIDPPPPLETTEKSTGFLLEAEVEFILRNLPAKADILEKHIRQSGSAQLPDQLWPITIEYLKKENLNPAEIVKLIPGDMARAIPVDKKEQVHDIIYYLNVVRTLINAGSHYIPQEKIQGRTYVFKATRPESPGLQAWNKYCTGPIRYVDLEGDHYTILRDSNAIKLAEVLTNHLFIKGDQNE